MPFFEHLCVCDGRYLFTDIIAEARESCVQIGMQNSKNSKQSGATSKSSGLFTMMGKNLPASGSGGGGVRRAVVPPPSTILSTEAAVSQPPTRRIKVLPMQSNLSMAPIGDGDNDEDDSDIDEASETGETSASLAADPCDWKAPLSPVTDMPDRNDRESFLSRVLEKRMASVVYQNLLTLVSFLALDAIYFGEPLTDNGAIYEHMWSKYMVIMADSMLASTFWMEEFYAYLPNAEFPPWWKIKLDKFFQTRNIKPKFKSNNFCKGKGDEQIRIMYNGAMLFNKAKLAMREIYARVNCLWKDPKDFPSGTTQSAVLAAIRERAWPAKALALAESRTKTFKSKNPNFEELTYK